MPNLNRVEIMGHLGRDPELRSTDSGKSVCSFSVATRYKPKDGEEQTEWHTVVAWGKLAENCAQYLHKGRPAFVEGRLQTRKWTKDGVDRYTTEIVAFNVQFLGSRDSATQAAPQSTAASAPAAAGAQDDDLPF